MSLRIAIAAIVTLLITSCAAQAQRSRIVYPQPPASSVGKMQALEPIIVTETLLDGNIAMEYEPVISDGHVVYTTDRNGTWDLYYLDPLGLTDPLAYGSGYQDNADIDGTQVVYVDNSFGNDNIYIADLTTLQTNLIIGNAGRDFSPAISDTHVVFVTDRNVSYDVYIYDLVNNVEDPLITGPAIQDQPSIDGDLVAWAQVDQSEFNIYAKRLTGSVIPVAIGSGIKLLPLVSGNQISYLMALQDFVWVTRAG